MGIISHIWRLPFRHAGDRYFRTPNLHLASILFCHGFALVKVDRADSAHCRFVFRNSSYLQETVDRFNAKQALYVEARKLIYSWKTLRSKIRDDRF